MAVKLFIGSSANGEDHEAEIAYENSLYAHTTQDIEIVWMRQSCDPSSPFYGWNNTEWATPFTAFRWAIPEICNFKGRAIFTDIDMLNLHDISELYNLDMQGKPLLARYVASRKRHEFSVMLMDCDLMCDKVKPIEMMKTIPDIHQQLTKKFSSERYTGYLDPRWNCLDGEGLDAKDIWQLHFTRMASQPWKPSWYKGSLEVHTRPDLVALWESYRDKGIGTSSIPSYEPFGEYTIRGKEK